MKKFLSLFISFLFLFSLTACGDKTDVEVEKDSNTLNSQSGENQGFFDKQEIAESTSFTPHTVMDLFDGERRVWYFIDSEDGIAYDKNVKFIFVTENKKVTEFYYNMGGFAEYEGYPDPVKVIPERNPLFSDYFILSDFAEKNDDEILEMVRSRYADASQTYDFSLEYKYAQVEATGSPFIASELPYEIKYKGKFDASGNNLEYECVKFIDKPYQLVLTNTQFNFREIRTIENETYFQRMIKPTIIKDKEYVGFDGSMNTWWITENTYASLDKIVYDSPDGASEW